MDCFEAGADLGAWPLEQVQRLLPALEVSFAWLDNEPELPPSER
jgi:hypothetical protein